MALVRQRSDSAGIEADMRAAGEDDDAFHVLGGNQGDRVSIVRIGRDRLQGARRPLYAQTPQNVRRIFRSAQGSLSVALA